MIFKKKPEPESVGLPENEPENPFLEAANALAEMEENGELPEGFELSEAVKDRAFAELLQEFEPKAAVRIYAAEKRADEAEENVAVRLSEQARSRKALPKSTRTDRAVAPAPDYMAMSREAFSALEKQYRNAAHNGKRVHI
jgi:hypothetical protein